MDLDVCVILAPRVATGTKKGPWDSLAVKVLEQALEPDVLNCSVEDLTTSFAYRHREVVACWRSVVHRVDLMLLEMTNDDQSEVVVNLVGPDCT